MLSVSHRSWRFLLALLMLVGVASAVSAEGTITDVKVVGGNSSVRIEVSASGPVQHRAKALTQPQSQIIVDVFPAKLDGKVKGEVPINKGLVSSATVKQLTDNTVRVTVNTVSLPDYKVVNAAGSKGLTLSVSTVTMAEGKASTTPAEPVQAAQPSEPVFKLLNITGDWQKYKGLEGAEGTLKTVEAGPDAEARIAAVEDQAQKLKAAKSEAAAKAKAEAEAAAAAEEAPAEEAAEEAPAEA